MIDRPYWVPEKYKRLASTNTPELTYPYRGCIASFAIDALICRKNPSSINFLEVGIGSGDGVINCPYEPYFISASIEEQRIDYNGLIIDVNDEVIKNFINRTKIFYPYPQYQTNASKSKEAWDRYLRKTNQRLLVTHEPDQQLSFSRLFNTPGTKNLIKNECLKSGLLVADIPLSLKNKVISGEVSVLNADIATANIDKYGPFDFVSMLNVLHYLDASGQKIAFYNIAKNMAQDGFMVVDNSSWSPTFEHSGGWLGKQELSDLKLEPVFNGYFDEWQRSILLKRTK